MKQSVTIAKEGDKATLAIHEKCNLPDLQDAFESLSGNEVQAIAVEMPGSAASDFMLIQLLAYLRKLNKTVTLTWTDHKPATHLAHLIQTVIHK